MKEKLIRIGTTYLPVQNVKESALWYTEKLGAKVNYQDNDKAILDFVNQAVFLIEAKSEETSNFIDKEGNERFAFTFEVDGYEALKELHKDFILNGIEVGEIEDRGHAGNNFVFFDPNGNKFDVWSELSPVFKEKYRN